MSEIFPGQAKTLDRRRFMARLSGFGVAATVFPGTLWALAQERGKVTKEVITEAEKIAGHSFTDKQKDLMLKGFDVLEGDFAKVRAVPLPNGVSPALRFSPLLPGAKVPGGGSGFALGDTAPPVFSGEVESLAFMPATKLAALLKERQVTSTALTKMYLHRLKQYDPVLKCVVTLTDERALAQARKADEEIAAGHYRGPLHGIPWGVKDLYAVKGYRTTWGAAPYKDQVIDETATVVKRLDEAGAVLLAKLTTGALAMGDVWFGGMTRNPWDTKEGSSGSSAGPASAVAAGLVGFAMGTETLGSIVSPSTRCGCSGLRPTFGRVPRTGIMALSWSMDKAGPIARSVEDCAMVFDAVYGPDGHDGTVVEAPFLWNPDFDVRAMKVGYVKSLFERKAEEDVDAAKPEEDTEWPVFDRAVLDVLRKRGVDLVPVELPDLPADSMSILLNCEAAAAFDHLTRSGRDDLLVAQGADDWPNIFRQAQLIPAVEYIQANRARTVLMEAMAGLMEKVDAYVCPSFGGQDLTITNLTGHPCVVVPDGFRKKGTPTSISFIGNLYKEAELLALARAYQNATTFHEKHPEMKG